MRAVAVLAAALLLSSCTWIRHEIAPPAPPAAPPTLVKPDPKPHRPKPPAERPVMPVSPAPPPQAALPTPPPPPDYATRCHAMADNRADDARQLGASAADQAKMQNDTYRDCMAQSVKP